MNSLLNLELYQRRKRRKKGLSEQKKRKKEFYFPEKSRLRIIVKSDKRSKKSKVLARLFVAWLFEMLNKDVGWNNSYIY